MPDGNPRIYGKLQAPPREYDQTYMQSLISRIEALGEAATTPNYLLGTGMILVAVPTSPVGLQPGEVYSDSGTLKLAP